MRNMKRDHDHEDNAGTNPHMQHENHDLHHGTNHGEQEEAVESHTHLSHGQHVGAPSAPSHGRHAGHTVEAFRKRFWICLIVTIPILALTPEIQNFLGISKVLGFSGQNYVLFILSSFVYFYGGYPFLQGLVREIREKLPGMMTLIGVAITAAYVYSTATVFGLPGMPFFWELATLIDIMLLGHWLEMKSILGASRALEELARLMPSEAHKIQPDGSVVDTPLDKLVVGDRVLIKPGEKIPADGTVANGDSSVNESMLTGESKPVHKTTNAEVIGGSINGEGSLTVEVKKTGKDSFLSQVIDLVRQAQESKSRTQDLSNRVAFWLTIIALSVGALTFIVWLSVLKQTTAFSLERAVTVMVIACPHALGLAVPLVVAISTAIAAKSGLLIRDRAAFENARRIDAIIFDKTGTLTEGRFGVTDVVPFSKKSDSEVLKYAASIEMYSEHPIAKGITEATKDRLPTTNFRNITGEGAEAKVNGNNVKVVSPGYVRKQGISFPESDIEKLSSQGKTVVILVIDNEAIGAIALADIIRSESKPAISEIKSMGIRSIMMTGDNKQVAKWVSDELGLDEYFAEVLPQQKAEKVKEVQSRGLIVAMTGDGVNDAPALAQADVGIAIGSGTDVAVETADIVLVRSNPQDAVNIIKLARSTYSKMIQNLAWATGYNTFAIPLAAGVLYGYGILLSPALGAVFMSASTIIVAFNARLLRLEK
jgi:Cu2+-exporting ATPase